jgi:hypothetical protein
MARANQESPAGALLMLRRDKNCAVQRFDLAMGVIALLDREYAHVFLKSH